MGFEERERALREIDFRLDGLCSSDSARAGMAALAAVMEVLAGDAQEGTPEARQAAAVLFTVACYLRRSLERADLDGRVLLDAVNSLCWDRRHMVGDDLPEDLLAALGGPVSGPRDLIPVWRLSVERGCGVEMAEVLTWWAAADLVSDTVHLEEGEAVGRLSPLLAAFGEGRGGPGRGRLPN